MESATMAKAKHIKYPIDFEPELYKVAFEEAKLNEQTLAGYARSLIKQDLQTKGKWPVK